MLYQLKVWIRQIRSSQRSGPKKQNLYNKEQVTKVETNPLTTKTKTTHSINQEIFKILRLLLNRSSFIYIIPLPLLQISSPTAHHRAPVSQSDDVCSDIQPQIRAAFWQVRWQVDVAHQAFLTKSKDQNGVRMIFKLTVPKILPRFRGPSSSKPSSWSLDTLNSQRFSTHGQLSSTWRPHSNTPEKIPQPFPHRLDCFLRPPNLGKKHFSEPSYKMSQDV